MDPYQLAILKALLSPRGENFRDFNKQIDQMGIQYTPGPRLSNNIEYRGEYMPKLNENYAKTMNQK